MKFKFSYESLLEHRKLEEEIARRDFYEAQNNLDEQKAIYKELYTRLHEIEKESSQMQAAPIIPIEELRERDEFMIGQKIKIQRQRDLVINFTTIAEGKQEILINAAKERKILDKLKEKQKLEFKKALAKKEAKQTDEVIVTRFRAGGRL
jgi:flagellar FliJ protein